MVFWCVGVQITWRKGFLKFSCDVAGIACAKVWDGNRLLDRAGSEEGVNDCPQLRFLPLSLAHSLV